MFICYARKVNTKEIAQELDIRCQMLVADDLEVLDGLDKFRLNI